jgi:hypothetical protein
MASALPAVQMLWVEGPLSQLERLSIASFLAHGYAVHLYTYGIDGEVPRGTTLMDAGEIVAPSERFSLSQADGFGSVAPFSNRFRYKLLYERGGIWCDSDIVLLKPLGFLSGQDYWFASEYWIEDGEKKRMTAKVASCFLKAPRGSEAMRECYERALATDVGSAEWGATGAKLVADVVSRRRLGDSVLEPNVICPVACWDFTKLLSGMHTLPSDAYAIHFYNEMLRRNFFDKDAAYEPLCIYERLKAHYLKRTGSGLR